jgi:hypothetical protein
MLVVSFTPRPLFPPEKELLAPITYEAEWAPDPVWTRWWIEKFPDFAGTRNPGHPARSPALYHWVIRAPIKVRKRMPINWRKLSLPETKNIYKVSALKMWGNTTPISWWSRRTQIIMTCEGKWRILNLSAIGQYVQNSKQEQNNTCVCMYLWIWMWQLSELLTDLSSY